MHIHVPTNTLLLQVYLPHVPPGHVLPPGAGLPGPGLRPIHGGYYPPHPPPPAALPLPTYNYSKPVYAQPPPV